MSRYTIVSTLLPTAVEGPFSTGGFTAGLVFPVRLPIQLSVYMVHGRFIFGCCLTGCYCCRVCNQVAQIALLAIDQDRLREFEDISEDGVFWCHRNKPFVSKH
jgi:hypothetical protein